MHIDAAIAQRRFVSSFIKTYTAIHAPEQNLSEEIIPDTYEDGSGEDLNEDRVACNDGAAMTPDAVGLPPTRHCRVLIQAEDYGGGISMPYYGHIRPSADYFNSNLILQNFVVANISDNTNNVYFYDKRSQGKNADALCSLWLLYHLSTLKHDLSNGAQAAEVSFSLLDNCVGQNKSKAVLMFFAFLSVVFPYKKVVLCFFLPGHSHNIADRVIAWCRRATKGLNLYTPLALVKEVNKVKSVNGVFLGHNNPEHPFFVGWNEPLSKFFAAPAAGYTSNYLFEIDRGHCTACKTVDTPDEESISFAMIEPGNVNAIRKAVLADLFGPEVSSIFDASTASVRLSRHSLKELSAKKKKSLSAKYFSIPPQYLGYYPEVPDAIVNAGVEINALDNEKKEATDEKQNRRPGRPRKSTNKPRSTQPSILQFFSSPSKQ